MQLLRHARKRLQRAANFVERGRLRELDPHRDQMSVGDAHAIALRAETHGSFAQSRALEPPQNFTRLALHFLFFLRNVRDHVVGDVHRSHAGIARPGNRLHRCHRHGFETELRFQRSQRENQCDRRTVRVRHDIASAETVIASLRFDHPEMLGINFRNEQRHVRLHAPRRRIADHGITRAGKLLFDVARAIRRQAGENEIAIERRLRRAHRNVPHGRGHIAHEPPRARLGVRLILRAIRGRERRDLELRMVREQLNESLPHRAGGAQYSCAELLCDSWRLPIVWLPLR